MTPEDAPCTGQQETMLHHPPLPEALAVCSPCPHKRWCREQSDWAEADVRPDDLRGVWAGETPEQRYLRRKGLPCPSSTTSARTARRKLNRGAS